MEHAFAQPLTTSAPPRRAALAVLDAVQIANPCPAEWEAMGAVDGQARDRVRHCGECNLRVYNLSAMKRHDAQELLRASEGRLCVRLYRRHGYADMDPFDMLLPDGTPFFRMWRTV